jgi:phosphopantothenate synthetase
MKIETIANTIKEVTDVNIFEKTRRRDVVELRSVATYYLRKVAGLKYRQISDQYKRNGLRIHHATLIHSLNNYDIYKKYSESVQKAHLCLIDDNLVDARKYIIRNMSKMTADKIEKIEHIMHN